MTTAGVWAAMVTLGWALPDCNQQMEGIVEAMAAEQSIIRSLKDKNQAGYERTEA